MSPKLLLRHPKAVSTLDDLAKGAFQEVIDDVTVDKSKVESVILCSGKVYYDLIEEREKQKDKNKHAIIRIEQLFPFPAKKLEKILAGYSKSKSVVWTQEEPKNNGGWTFVFFKLQDVVESVWGAAKVRIHYAGRSERASPAIGSVYKSKIETQEFLESAFKY